ncbi:cadherin-like beta sandwich domain-containing protein [Candidatus Poriferisodalis sp.]|uniref:cadherin-like beta sandwich domain-containing protein n=1 Tax=Candidatus Poriferisodalis sp. TaxID=3101277 RepID=UPI003B5943F4
MAVVLVGVLLPHPASAQSSPSVALTLSSSQAAPGTAIAVTMSFAGLEADSDGSDIDYVFRVDVVGADECEDQAGGQGLGVDRYMYKVDEDPEVRTGTVSADCPAGDYAIKAVIASAANVELASASASFTIGETAADEEAPPPPEGEACSESGDGPTPTTVEVEAVPIVVESTAQEYFVLYVLHDLDGSEVEVPVSVTRGAAGTTTLAENIAALPKERYRVRKFFVADPADVDGDCIDDITELADPVGMNPVNPAAAVGFNDGAVIVPDRSTLERIAGQYLKFILLGMDTDNPRLYFMNSRTHPLHGSFLSTLGLEEGSGFVGGLISHHSEVVGPHGSPGVYSYFLVPRQPFSVVDRIHTILAANMPLLEDDLVHYMSNHALVNVQHELASYEASRIGRVFERDIYPSRLLSLNPGEGYGYLRVMEPGQRPNPRDVVIYKALPNELPRVAGIITTVPQTPLSHVNLRAVQHGVPNAYVRGVLEDNDIKGLIGGYVRYEVTADGYSIRKATRAEVDAHFASSRPAVKQSPQRDLSVTEIKPLSAVGFDDWEAFGVKAANVAVLGTLGFPAGTVPDGFAVPFYFYDEFMKHNGFYDDIEEMLADSDFQTDYATQESKLKKLRKAIKKGETPQWIVDALTDMHAEFPAGTSLRYRSSTNNEDLPGFNGAGLYDSKTQHADETEEDGIDKSLKQVYASLWNFRAFVERDFHRVDHLAAAMGVLVHPNYSDELANGVAVSFDPVRGRSDRYYVNTQIGEDLVTNPEAHSTPEEVLLYSGGGFTILAISNQAEPGQLLMTQVQLDQLRRHLTTIHNKFDNLYNPASGESFAMEIEFKITSANILAIKQARPWVFGPAEASGSSGTVALSLAQPRVGAVLSAALTDPDSVAGVAAWEWHRSPYGQVGWVLIDGATSAAYTPVTADVGSYLRATASYTDGQGNSKSAERVSDNVVQGLPVVTIDSVTAGDGSLTVAWTAPSSTAAAITAYDLRHIESSADKDDGNWTVVEDVWTSGSGSLEHTVTGLTNGVSYDVQVREVFADGDGAWSASARAAPASTGPEVAIGLSPSGTVEPGTEVAVTMSFAGLEADSDGSDIDYVFRADVVGADECEVRDGGYGLGVDRYMYRVDDDPEIRTGAVSADCPAGDYTVRASISSPDNVELASATADFTVGVPAEKQPPPEPLSEDAALSGLSLSDVDFGGFDPATTGYSASVANDVEETTVTATTNDGGAVHVVKLDGAPDADGTVSLAVGSNAIAVEVTAADGQTTRTYTVTVTRAAPASTGPEVAIGLSPSGTVEPGTEVAVTMSFAGLEADSDGSDIDYVFRADVVGADECEVRDGGYGLGVDRYMYRVDDDPEIRTGAVSADCPAGDYTVRASISSPDNVELASATADFTVGVPAEKQPPPLSTDATLSGLALSGVDIGVFDPAATRYSADVANDVSETTVTPTVSDDGASYVVELDGAPDGDGTVSLAVGSNVIAVEVTAADGQTTRTYTVTVTRAAPPEPKPITPPGLVLSETSVKVHEDGTATIEVRLATEPSAAVTMTIASADTAVATASPATLTFGTTSWSTARTVTIAGTDDTNTSDDSTTITLTATGGDYDTVTADVAVTVTDDDPSSFSAADAAAYVAIREELAVEMAGPAGYPSGSGYGSRFYAYLYKRFADELRQVHGLHPDIPLGETSPNSLPDPAAHDGEDRLRNAIDALAVAAGLSQDLIDAAEEE